MLFIKQESVVSSLIKEVFNISLGLTALISPKEMLLASRSAVSFSLLQDISRKKERKKRIILVICVFILIANPPSKILKLELM